MTTKLLAAVRLLLKKEAASHFNYAMKTESVEIRTDEKQKVAGHNEDLQLLTFCEYWENVEAS